MAEEAVAAGAIIQVLVEKLATLAEKKISLVRHFKGDLETLKESLTTVQAFLHDAENKKVTSSAVKVWLGQLEDLAFDADNVIDDIDYELLSKKIHLEIENKTEKEKVPSCFPCCSIFLQNKTVKEKNNERMENHPISFRLEMGDKIKVINERLEKINQRATASGLQESLASAPDKMNAYENREENAFAKDPIFLGRENEVSEIVEMLITTTPPAGQKSSVVLPIVGMGGQGKTTIAREVYHDEKIKSHFGYNRLWVYVSKNFDVLNIMKKILTSITKEKSELETQQDILEELQEHLGAKKYLLVLDDVWNEDVEKWDAFVNSLSGISSASNGCYMVVTTRIEDVASIVKETLPVHKLKGLPEHDCWSIIKAKAFRGSDIPSLEIEEIGKNIARKCQGLPLAAKVVGGLLSSKESKDECMSIEKSWLSDPKNPMSNVLKLSFDHLPSPSLKKCFAYCSIFPKGKKIKKERLVELWIAEGFLHTNCQKGNKKFDMETTGCKNFSFLLRNSLLQDVRSDDYGNVTHCSMHDLLHDLACSVLCENDDVMESFCKRRYIGYEPSGDGFSSIPEEQEIYVRTLFVDGKVSSIKFFDDFESLHTLTLVGYDIDDLPTSIKKLKHLRYLDISKTEIESLPDWIGELYHLQTLRLQTMKTHVMMRLPDSLSCLISLRHLHIPDDATLPPKMGKLASLQTLPYFYVGDENGCGISELGPLKNLKGELQIHNLYKLRNKIEAMGADLNGKTGINKLKLSWLDGYRQVEVYDANVHESVLEGLQPHPNLERLEIYGFKGKILSLRWERLNNLKEITLEGCSECEELPNGLFSNNHNLSRLDIQECPKMTRLGPFLQGGGASSLRMLRIIDCSSFRELHSINSVERLFIWGCPDLKSIPYSSREGGQQQQGFTSLVKLYIEKCNGLTDLSIEMLESCALSLESLELNELNNLTNVSEVIGCLNKMTRLTYLLIQDVPKLSIRLELKSLAMGPSLFDSSMNNVTFNETFDLLQPSQILITLRSLYLRGMDHWDCDCLPDGFQHLTSLEKLELSGFGIEAWPEWSGNYLPTLEKLILFDCKRLRHLPSTQALIRLTKLIELDIRECPLLLKEESFNNIDSECPTMNNISLQRLTLSWMVQLDCVPDQLQHLNALSFLHLEDLGIEALPEWLENLASLKTLELNNCQRLRHLPSKQAMQHLSKLTTLDIRFCPLLLKEKSGYPEIVDSEWAKISHIPIVRVNWTTYSHHGH